ncbi:hypothetical protein [Alkalihalobacillus sp. TS-13]|uniref:hypothetical protein n=1 Tax=Alkalihalobacillus sp. TS-13 TaxID=2842455 RepID=UPI001C8771D2|nr:hypothetical protein [Alkalihalobacillus sp. TS-13]
MDRFIGGTNCFNCEKGIKFEASFTDLNFESVNLKAQAIVLGAEWKDNKKYLRSAVKVECPECNHNNVFVFLRAENEIYFTTIKTEEIPIFG